MNSPRELIHSIVSGVVAAAVFLGLFFLASVPIWLAAPVGIGSYAGVYLLTKPKMRIGNLDISKLQNNADLQKLMLDAYDDMQVIERIGQKMSNLPLQDKVMALRTSGVRMLEFLNQHPDRIPAARKFLGYYLETTRNILERYWTIERSGVSTEEVRKVRAQAEHAIPVLQEAFEKQFTHLMENDILEIEAEVKLLEMDLKADGKL